MFSDGHVDPKHFKDYIHKRQIEVKKANMPLLNKGTENEVSKEGIDMISSHDQFNLFSWDQLDEQ